MEVNKEEALRCLSIANRHRSQGNLTTSLKFAKKSISLYSTDEGISLIEIIEREILISSSSTSDEKISSGSSTPGGGTGAGSSTSTAKASGVEEHVTSAYQRPGHGSSSSGTSASASASAGKSTAGSSTSASTSTSTSKSAAEKPKKREYTVKQVEVVKRVKSCQHHQYYEILSVEKSCSENDVKRAYKKLALALHPDKNGAPGADEAFKMVSKAFQVLSDDNLRAAYDSNPNYDPTQRGGGGGMSSRGGGGGMHPGFGGGNGVYTEINPEDLFNAFFGGGMGGGGFGNANVFTFGGPGGFSAQFGNPRRRPGQRTPNGGGNPVDGNTSPLIALLPLLVLFLFAIISILPNLFGSTAARDPSYSWETSTKYDMERKTWHRGIPYYVNGVEWTGSGLWESVPEGRRSQVDAAMYSSRVRSFERGVESQYIGKLRNECDYFIALQNQRVQQESGFFGIGADFAKIKQIRAEVSPSCEQLSNWGLLHHSGATF